MTMSTKMLAIGVVIAAIVGWGLYSVARRSSPHLRDFFDPTSKVVDQKLDALREAGIPIDNASMDAWYDQHADATHASAWLRVFAILDSAELKPLLEDVRNGHKLPKVNSWPAEAANRALLSKTTELRKKIRQLALARVPVRFPYRADSFQTPSEHLAMLRKVYQLNDSELETAIYDKNSPEIAASAQTHFHLAIVARSDERHSSQTCATGFRYGGMFRLKMALEQDLIQEADLKALATSLSQEQLSGEHLCRAFHAERADFLSFCFNPEKYADGDIIPKSYKATSKDILHYLKFFERLESACHLPMAELLQTNEAAESDLKKSAASSGLLEDRDWYPPDLMLYPLFSRAINHCRDCQQLNMVLHGIAIRRYQDQFGEFPRDLFALQDIGFDTLAHMPVGNKPMGYRLEGDEAVLWSTPLGLGLETTPEPIVADKTNGLTKDRTWEQMTWRFAP
ncbi:MAG: hypothetical protein ACO1RA_08735 [Planctomycetaceae bacterium]